MLRTSLAALLLCAAGCTPAVTVPRTYPATGRVVYKNGQPLRGGSVQFNSASDPLLRVMGTIDADGNFTLTTLKDTARADGAPAGEYKVFVLPPSVADARDKVPDGHKGAMPIVLPKAFKLDEGENTIRIELPTSPSRS